MTFVSRPSEWFPFFAWWPVQTITGGVRWLCWVECRRVGRVVSAAESPTSQGDLLTIWEYRDVV